MARINIEEQWWTDPRREALSNLLGDELLADGAVIRLWRLAQEYWKLSEPIPNHVFEHVRYRSELVACSLAVVRTEGVFVRGCSKHFAWITKQKENASKAGKKSAENRKAKHGTAQPKPSLNGVSPNDPRTPVRTTSNDPEPSSSSSSSSSPSSSSSKSKKTIAAIRTEYPQEFDKVWEAYGRKGEKKAAYQEWLALKLTDDEKKDLDTAISSYVAANEVKKYRKDFERFLKSDWREHLKSNVVDMWKDFNWGEK